MAERKTTTRETTATRKRRATVKPQVTSSDVDKKVTTTIEAPFTTPTEEIERPDLAMVTDEDMSSPTVKEYVQDLAFMNQVLTISIGLSSDPNAEDPVSCGVNGEVRNFKRGEQYKTERKFVNSLIKRINTVKTVQYKDADGCDQTRIDTTPVMKYPIQIHADPAGTDLSRRWFAHVCEFPE